MSEKGIPEEFRNRRESTLLERAEFMAIVKKLSHPTFEDEKKLDEHERRVNTLKPEHMFITFTV